MGLPDGFSDDEEVTCDMCGESSPDGNDFEVDGMMVCCSCHDCYQDGEE